MKNEPLFMGAAFQEEEPSYNVWEKAGFRFGDKGTHTSRTIMLEELSLLFQECPGGSTREDYLKAIVEDNCLGKRTVATRNLSAQRLSELYGLNPAMQLFRFFRYYWDSDQAGRPLLSLLTAMSRDPLLRITSTAILDMQPGEELTRQKIVNVLQENVGKRLNESTLNKVVRNASSSWTQSGHLKGRMRKIRQKVDPTPIVTAYALLLGYLLGIRGPGLFKTLWSKVLDTPEEELLKLALEAKRLGLVDMSLSGNVVEVSFSRMLSEEGRFTYGKN